MPETTKIVISPKATEDTAFRVTVDSGGDAAAAAVVPRPPTGKSPPKALAGRGGGTYPSAFPGAPMDREVRLVLLVCACHALTHALMLVFPTVILAMGAGSIPLTDGEFGLLYGVVAFLFGAGALPVGYLADRIGSRAGLLIGMAGAGLSALACGLATSKALFAGAICSMGFFLAFYHPTGLSWLTRQIRQRGMALGYHGVAGNLGLTLGPALAGGIASLAAWSGLVEGWRAAFFLMGGVTTAVAALAGSVKSADLPQAPEEPAAPPPANEPAAKPSFAEFGRTLGLPLAMVLLNGVFFGLLYRGLVSYLPKLASAQVSWISGDMGKAGLIVGISFLFGIVGQLVGGYLNERLPNLELANFFIYAAGAGGCIALALVTDYTFLLVLAALNLSLFLWQPINNNLIAIHTPRRLHGIAYGVYFTIQFAIGGLAPWLLGLVAGASGVQATFYVCAGFAGLGLVTSYWVFRYRKAETTLLEWLAKPAGKTPCASST